MKANERETNGNSDEMLKSGRNRETQHEETSDLVNHAYMQMNGEFQPRCECDDFDTLGFHHDNKMTLFRII